jgi:AraC-like DNA-binding protein
MADPLTDALGVLRISTTLYAMAQLSGDWGVGFPKSTGAYFHVVEGTACRLRTDGTDQDLELSAGDVVLLPHGTPHRLTNRPGGRVRTVFDPVTWTPCVLLPPAGDAVTAGTGLVCGEIRISRPGLHPLLSTLPDVVVVAADSPGSEELLLTCRLLAAEFRSGRPGTDTVLARLGDVLVVQVLRIWAARPRSGSSWLAALEAPGIGDAVRALHAAPAAPWTLADLARTAAMSRSRFAERFTGLVGVPPLTYLARWRMTMAAQLLAEPDATVRDVARRVGFTSEPAFSRAFTRHHGTSPSRYRRDAPSEHDDAAVLSRDLTA